ncbi:MAG: DUF5104 domain-containing protein [Eubacterium sp.]|nr:DUF5104 domain-containing protein [Eubacterium sp.]
MLKKYIYVLSVCIILIFLSSCSVPDTSHLLHQDAMGYTPKQIKTEIMPKVAETVVEALETSDEDKLKSVFSANALAEAESRDLDEGVKYLFDSYKGKHTEIRDYNYSQYENYKKDESINEIDCVCYVETDDKTYKLSWLQILKDESDADNVGVYNLVMYEWEEGYNNEGGIYVGIDYPERFSASYITSVIGAVGYTDSTSALDIPLLYVSDKLLNNMSDSDKNDFSKALLVINNKNIRERWCEPSEDGSSLKSFIAADIPNVGKIILSFSCDQEVRNEIISIKITMYEGEVPDSQKLVTENYQFEGLHEFVQECEKSGMDFSKYPKTSAELYKEEVIPEIEYDGKTLQLASEIQNPGSSNGDVLGKVDVNGSSYSVTKLNSDYGCDVYLINHKVYAEKDKVDGLNDYYENDADMTFTYYEYKKSGSDEHEIDFSMEMYSKIRDLYNDESQLKSFKADRQVKSFEIKAKSSDGVYDGHISVNVIDDSVMLGSKIVPNVVLRGYFLPEEEAKYIIEHID